MDDAGPSLTAAEREQQLQKEAAAVVAGLALLPLLRHGVRTPEAFRAHLKGSA